MGWLMYFIVLLSFGASWGWWVGGIILWAMSQE